MTSSPSTPARPPRRTQEERSRLAREKLIQSAVELICLQGFTSTTTQQIASNAGLTRGAIQHHFGGRAELFAEVVHQVQYDWQRSFDVVATSEQVGLENKIDVLIDNLWQVVCTPLYRAAVDICFNSRVDPELRAVVQKAINSSTQHFTNCWYKTFSPDASREKIRETCALVSSITQGLVLSAIYTEKPETLPVTAQKTFATAKKLIIGFMLAPEE